MNALQMALQDNAAPLIHHSDRGSQYVYKSYIELLKQNDTQISMALSAQDNAYAERINRTIKEEYLDYRKPQILQQLKKAVNKAVYHYNNQRPHNNIGKLSPVEFEKKWFNNQFEAIPVVTIFDNKYLTVKTVNYI
ncbi:MAG: integrase core domain-containing protein [Chitinophagaceae bacterium]|nr:integrase core domain-containing protein [Chitinophagaceae bacterium]MCW5905828.1 integrase core domain-containing protein [Chitinophagaceae bacterium]